MKKVIIAVMVVSFNMFLFSCTDDSVSGNDSLYENQATEGDDGQIKPPPGDDD